MNANQNTTEIPQPIEDFDFQAWLQANGFKLAKMYNPRVFDYDIYIEPNNERVVVSFSDRRVAGEMRIDIGSTTNKVGQSFSLKLPESPDEALMLLRFHSVFLG